MPLPLVYSIQVCLQFTYNAFNVWRMTLTLSHFTSLLLLEIQKLS